MDLDVIDWMLVVLALLFVKHWYVDFVNQTNEEIQHKGLYLDWRGVKHSLKHGLATMAIFAFMGDSVIGAVILGFLDFSLHYHIDWLKMNYGSKDITTPQFWNHLGLDQLAHYLVYLALIWLTVAEV
jgi:hypothetical protein